MLTDEELEKFVKKDMEKEITQLDSIDEVQVKNAISEMGWLWNSARKKLEKDKFCFRCKKIVDLKKEPLRLLEATSEKGAFITVSVCDKCFNELDTEFKKQKEKNEKGE